MPTPVLLYIISEFTLIVRVFIFSSGLTLDICRNDHGSVSAGPRIIYRHSSCNAPFTH